jgi:hypothetical protein
MYGFSWPKGMPDVPNACHPTRLPGLKCRLDFEPVSAPSRPEWPSCSSHATSAPAFVRISGKMPATAPLSSSGSYQRGRGRGLHGPSNERPLFVYFEDHPPPPPLPIYPPTYPSQNPLGDFRPLGNHTDFVSSCWCRLSDRET